MSTKQSESKSPKKRPELSVLRFSGMAFTMAAAIGLFLFGGIKLDQHLENETPWATISGALFGLTAGFYIVLKDLTRS